MTGIPAVILYYRAHREEEDWGDADDGIIELLKDEAIEYDPLRDMIYYAKTA